MAKPPYVSPPPQTYNLPCADPMKCWIFFLFSWKVLSLAKTVEGIEVTLIFPSSLMVKRLKTPHLEST